VDSLDDTISQVFDEMHSSPNDDQKTIDDPSNQGFIATHLKKL